MLAAEDGAPLKKPAAVIATTVICGILSFLTFVLPIGAEDPTGMASLIPKIMFTVAFIAAISGTVGGRRVIIAVMLLLQVSSVFGFLAAIRQFSNNAGGALATAVLAALPVAWFYWYVFGAPSRAYFLALREKNLRVAANNSLQARRP